MITPALLNTFRADLDAALEAVYAKHGLTGKSGKITYMADNFSIKLDIAEKAAVTSSTGFVADPVLYRGTERHGYSYGLNVEQLGKTFISGGKEYVFMGINQTGHFAVGKRVSDGVGYKFRDHQMKTVNWNTVANTAAV